MSELRNGCGKVRDLLEAYFEGVLPEPQERLVAEHLWQCSRCAAELEQIRRFSVALSAMPVAEPEGKLLAAISARIAALPAPGERRFVFGWRRLGLAEVLALALLAVAWLGVSHFGPSLLVYAKPVTSYFGQLYATCATWVNVNYHALLRFLGLTWEVAPALGQAALGYLPKLALYVGVEVALVIGTAFLSRRHRRTACVPSRRS